MAAMLRSGKFLRVVSGIARHNVTPAVQQRNEDPAGIHAAPQTDNSNSSSHGFHNTASLPWIQQHLQSALPFLGATEHASEDRYQNKDIVKTPLINVSEAKQLTDNKEILNTSQKFLKQDNDENATKSIQVQSTTEVTTEVIAEQKDSSFSEEHCQILSATPAEIPAIQVDHTKDSTVVPIIEVAKVSLDAEDEEENAMDIVEEDTRQESNQKRKQLETSPEESKHKEQKVEPPSTPHVPYQLPVPPQPISQPNFVPMIQLFDAYSNAYQWYNLHSICEMYLSEGRTWDLEGLLYSTQGTMRPEDRKWVYFCTLRSFVSKGLFDKAVELSRNLSMEGLAEGFNEFHHLMSTFAQSVVQASGYMPPHYVAAPGSTTASTTSVTSSSLPPTPASELNEQHQTALQSMLHRKLKKALAAEQLDDAMAALKELQKTGKVLNVTESSSLIEQLIKKDRVTEATSIAEGMLAREAYPLPKIFRFLLNRLAANGDVEAMSLIGRHLNSKVKKEVSFDNRLCNAFLAAGKGAQFLQMLQKDLDESTPDTLAIVQERFPRGGAMGLLESEPELLEPYTRLANRYAETGYVAPMNVLWTYHFINGRHDLAAPLWETYVKNCPQIMFQKVCQTARSSKNLEMAERLVGLLQSATVTSGAKGIAYSCLLDVLSQRQEFTKGLSRLTEAVKDGGVKLEDVNRTAMVRLKAGLEQTGEKFPYEIPKKTVEKERSTSPMLIE